jgi:hypothetical protein
MMKWVQLARQGKEGTAQDGIPAVNIAAPSEWADKVEQRLHLLRFTVKPFFEDDDERTQIN